LINTELIAGGVAIIGGAGVVLHRLGLITFGKNNKPRTGICPDSSCQANVQTAVRHMGEFSYMISDVRKQQEKLEDKMDKVLEDVAYMRGKFDKLSENSS